ncbi:hypothetical protein AKJ16_DCAP11266 [Drosera capensis]
MNESNLAGNLEFDKLPDYSTLPVHADVRLVVASSTQLFLLLTLWLSLVIIMSFTVTIILCSLTFRRGQCRDSRLGGLGNNVLVNLGVTFLLRALRLHFSLRLARLLADDNDAGSSSRKRTGALSSFFVDEHAECLAVKLANSNVVISP